MEIKNLHNLLGIEDDSINWHYPLLFFGALFISQLFSFFIRPEVYDTDSSGFEIIFINIMPAWIWLRSLIGIILKVVLIVFFLRYIKKIWIAILIIAISYTLLDGLISSYIYQQFQLSIDVPAMPFWRLFTEQMPFMFLYNLCFLGGISLALRFIKSIFPALLLGTISGSVIFGIVLIIFALIKGTPINFDSGYEIVLNLLPDIIFVISLFMGIIIAKRIELTTVDKEYKLNKAFKLIAMTVLYGVPWVLFFLIYVLFTKKVWEKSDAVPAIFIIIISFLILVGGMVTFCKIIYRMWNAIQDGHARTTPSRAVGFLFIPLFNFYWAFQVFYGFTVDYNNYIRRHSVKENEISGTISVVFVILSIIGFLSMKILIVNSIVSLVTLIVLIIMISKICDAVNILPNNLKGDDV